MILEHIAQRPALMVVIAAEVGFWVVLGLGLAARYLLRWRRTSIALLLALPLIDVAVLVATVVDLRGGAAGDFSHGLAAAYLGFSIVFGRDLVRWADQRVAHRFADGPPPWRPPAYGADHVRYQWREWVKCVGACAIAAIVLLVLIAVGTDGRVDALWQWLSRLGLVVGVWFVGWPLWATLWPPRQPVDAT